MVVFHNYFPRQTVIPVVIVHQGKLTTLILYGIIQACFLQLSCTHVAIYHFIVYRKIRSRTQSKSPQLSYATIAYVNKRSRLSGIHIYRMAVAVMIHSRKLTPVIVITFCQGKLINLCAILERSRFDFECSRVKILIDTSTIEPIVSNFSIQIQRELLHAEMIRLIIQCSMKTFFTKLSERIDCISDITGCNGSF